MCDRINNLCLILCMNNRMETKDQSEVQNIYYGNKANTVLTHTQI